MTPGASAGLLLSGGKQLDAANGTIKAPPITKAPPPVSYLANGQPIFGVNASLPDKYDSGVLDLRWGMGNCSMRPGYDGYNAKSCSCVNRIGDWYHEYATDTITSEQCQLSYIAGYATDVQSLGCSSVTVTQLSQNYTAPIDCCDKCVVRGKAVHLVYWRPRSAQNQTKPQNANITIAPPEDEPRGVVSDGFTFISPSVYVIYTDIGATASCVARVASSIDIGTIHTLVTRAYAPDALKTAPCIALDAGAEHSEYPGWEAINYADFYDPPPSSVMLSEKQKCFTNPIDAGFAASIYQSPQLSFPPDVTDIDPQWASWGGNTCTPIYLGVADPPRELGEASALVRPPKQPVTAAADFGPQPTPAQPAGQVDPQPKPTSVAQTQDFHAPAPAMVGPTDNKPGKSANAQEDSILYDPAKPAPPAQNQGNENTMAVYPAPVNNDPVSKNGGTQKGSSNMPNQQVDPVHEAPAPATDPQPQQQSQPHIVNPNGGTAQQGTDPENQRQTGETSDNSVTATSGGGTTSIDNDSPSNADPQTVPIVLTPQQPTQNNKATIEGQSQSQGQGQPAVQPATDTQQSSQGQVSPQSNNNSPTPATDSTISSVNTPPQTGDQPVQKQANGNVLIGGTTIPQGSETTVNGDTVLNGPDYVVVDGATHASALTPNSGATQAPNNRVSFVKPPPQISGQDMKKQSNGNVVVGGTTVSEGTQTAIDGHTIINAPNHIVVDGATYAVAPTAASAVPPDHIIPFVKPPPEVGGQTVEKQTNGNVVVGGTTIEQDTQSTVNGHTIFNAPDHVIVDGATYALAPTPVPVAVPAPFLANNEIVQVSNGGLKVASQTIVPGSQVNIAGHVVNYVEPGQVIVDGTTKSLTPVSTANPLVIGSQTLSRAANGGLVIAGSTVAPEAQAAVAGHTYSMAGDTSVMVDGQTYALPPTRNAYLVQAVPSPGSSSNSIDNSPSPVTLGNGLVITPQPDANGAGSKQVYNLPNGVSVSADGPAAEVSGTTYSALPSGAGFLVNGASTLEIPTTSPVRNDVFTIADQTFTAIPSGFVLSGGPTLSPGGAAATVSGTRLSLGPSGVLVLGSNTLALPSQSVFEVGGNTFTAEASGFAIAPGTYLTPGGPGVTISATPVSLAPNSELQIGTTTMHLGAHPTVFTLSNGEVFTAQPTGFVIDGSTITPGGLAATISNEVVSLGKSGDLHLGSATVTLGSAPTSTQLGPAILSGLNGGGGAAPTGAPGSGEPVQGVVGRREVWRMGAVVALGIGTGILGWVI
ncbi:MAG: hypothetical protein Q9217_001406 [Psora testacea]